jgi:uncharacterized protein (TIGR02246 family)
MKKFLCIFLVLIAGAVLVFGNGKKEDPEEVMKAIQQVFNNYSKAIMSSNVELFVSIHTDDVVKMPQDAPSQIGGELLREDFINSRKKTDVKNMEIKIKEVEVSDDLAFARGTYSMDFIIKANGAVIPYEGKYLTVFKKQSDGSWKIYRDSYSSNTPPAK